MLSRVLKFFKLFRASHLVLAVWLFGLFSHSFWKTNPPPQRNRQIINNDLIMYYQYLPAVFVFKDPGFGFAGKMNENFHGNIWVNDIPGGGRYIKMTMGMSVLYLPFFVAGHITAKLLDYTADGYSIPYMFFMSFSGAFYAFLGLLLIEKILRRYYSPLVTALVIVTVGLATNMYFYVVYEGMLTHAHNFFLISLFLFLTIRWYEKINFTNSILMGLVYGLIVLIRPSNGIVILLPMLYGIKNLRSITDRFRLIGQHYLKLIVAGLFAIMVLFPQLLLWKLYAGSWFVWTYGNEKFFFNNPHILEGLISYRSGWLVYTPVMLLALAGFFFLRKYADDLKWALPVFFLVNIYVVFSWWCWWYGGYSIRSMVDCYALMCIPMAALIQYVIRIKYVKVLVYPVLGFFVYLSFFQTEQHLNLYIHYSCNSRESFHTAFLKRHPPDYYWDLLKSPDHDAAMAGKDEPGGVELFP